MRRVVKQGKRRRGKRGNGIRNCGEDDGGRNADGTVGMAHHRLGRENRMIVCRRLMLAHPGQCFNLVFHVSHLVFHFIILGFPMIHLPLELIQFRTVLVSARRSTFAITFPALFFTPFGDFFGRHVGEVGWSVAILGHVVQWRLLLVGGRQRVVGEAIGVGGGLALLGRGGLLLRVDWLQCCGGHG